MPPIPVTMTFDNRRNRVRIQKSTLDALGNPLHILPMVNEKKKTFVLHPITPEEAQSLGYSSSNLIEIDPSIYEQGKPYEYQNNRIMPWLRSFLPEWKPYAEYRVKGEIREGSAFLHLDQYEIILQGKPLRILS